MTAAHGGQPALLAREFGLDTEDILDFSANINPDGPPRAVYAALEAALAAPETLTRYPDLEGHAICTAFARFAQVACESVLVANGFVPLLEASLRALLLKRCLLPLPCFSEYRSTLDRCGLETVPYATQQAHFRYDLPALARAVDQSGADALLLANPQNPAGLLTSAHDLHALLEACPRVILLLDEAFIDYEPEQSLARLAAVHPRLIVFRSVTKFFAIPGLRIAFAVAAPQSVSKCVQHLPPWPVSTLAEIAVIAALAEETYQVRTRADNLERRQWLASGLERIHVPVTAAAANFLLLHLPQGAKIVRERMLREHRIHLRTASNFAGLEGDYLRAAVRTQPENERLLEALARVLEKRS